MDNDRFARRERPWLFYLLLAGMVLGGIYCLVMGQPGGAVLCLIFGLLFGCAIYLPYLRAEFDGTLEKDRMEHLALRTSIRVPKLKEPRPASPPTLPDDRTQKPDATA